MKQKICQFADTAFVWSNAVTLYSFEFEFDLGIIVIVFEFCISRHGKNLSNIFQNK